MQITFGFTLTRLNLSRAAVVPYTIRSGKIHFMMGIDKKYKDISDFGGGVKKNENPLNAALREFEEESIGIFPKDMYSSLVKKHTHIAAVADNINTRYVKSMCCLFIPVDEEWIDKSLSKFNKRITNSTHLSKCQMEIGDILWISEDNIHMEITTRMWKSIRDFYLQLLVECAFLNVLRIEYEKTLRNNSDQRLELI